MRDDTSRQGVACTSCGYPGCDDAGPLGEGAHPAVRAMVCPHCTTRFACIPGDNPARPSRRFWELVGTRGVPLTAATRAWADALVRDRRREDEAAAAALAAVEAELEAGA